MNQREQTDDLFHTSQLTILLTYTIFSVILIAESLLLGWEIWALILIVIGVIAGWIIHIQQRFTEQIRIWIMSILIMFTFFFYGSHKTSAFDTVAVMSVVMILFTMTGIRSLITFLQIVYYITFGYSLASLYFAGETFDALVITRSALHVATVTAVAWISRTIISKWLQVLNRSRDEIEQLTSATNRLNDFLANVSHEIRTPINAVIGLTGVCIEGEQNEERVQSLISVRNAGHRVADQIGDILDYSEIDSGRLANNFEDYMLSSVLNDLMMEIRPYKPDSIELVIDVDPAIPSIMNSDINKLKKILRHLIMNGLKYTNEGGVYVRISVAEEPYGVNLMIEVTDTGIGMDDEQSERIYDGFYQADSGRSRQVGGLGLGLSIVSGFVSSLGGFMMINSSSGKGTTVKVSIPQKVIDPNGCMSVRDPDHLCLGAFLHFEKYKNPNVREYYNQMVRHIVGGLGVQMHRVDNAESLRKLVSSVNLTHLFVADEEYLSATAEIEKLASKVLVIVVANESFKLVRGSKCRIMEKPFYCFPVVSVLNTDLSHIETVEEQMYCRGVRALVVDDEPMNLSVARSIFKRYGMIVSTASSGMDSVELCREREYDIVFMDHMMPGMDGVEAMKQIRSVRSGARKDMPIVALTANAVSSAKEMFLSVGFDGFVSKPVETMELERVLKRVLPKSAITYEKPEPTENKAAGKDAVQGANSGEVGDVLTEESAELKAYEKLRNYGFDTHLGMEYCQNDDELYESLLKQFVTEYPAKREKIEKFFLEKDHKNYEIYVHALKSTAKMIGNMALSEQAKDLEFAAKDRNAAYIESHHNALVHAYETTMQRIAMVYEMNTDEEKPADSGSSDDEVLVFSPEDADQEEVMEFAPEKAEEDEILIFEPKKGEKK